MIITDRLIYHADDQVCEGFVSYDNATKGKSSGVLIAHTFRGQSDFETDKSVELAKMGYVAFALDLYGQGRRAESPEHAGKLMQELNTNRPLLLRRMLAALDILQNHGLVDSDRIAAIGFCFGGKCVLDLARSGAAVKGVVSFHGIYDPPPSSADAISASILVLHGWDDPLAPPSSATQLAMELTEKKADWQILAFGHTGHAFTNPNAQDKSAGMFYQENADRRSWKAMQSFLAEVFS